MIAGQLLIYDLDEESPADAAAASLAMKKKEEKSKWKWTINNYSLFQHWSHLILNLLLNVQYLDQDYSFSQVGLLPIPPLPSPPFPSPPLVLISLTGSLSAVAAALFVITLSLYIKLSRVGSSPKKAPLPPPPDHLLSFVGPSTAPPPTVSRTTSRLYWGSTVQSIIRHRTHKLGILSCYIIIVYYLILIVIIAPLFTASIHWVVNYFYILYTFHSTLSILLFCIIWPHQESDCNLWDVPVNEFQIIFSCIGLKWRYKLWYLTHFWSVSNLEIDPIQITFKKTITEQSILSKREFELITPLKVIDCFQCLIYLVEFWKEEGNILRTI